VADFTASTWCNNVDSSCAQHAVTTPSREAPQGVQCHGSARVCCRPRCRQLEECNTQKHTGSRTDSCRSMG
jgi:hypothetical protein